MDLITGLFSASGLSASAGLNAYIPLLVIALTARYTPWLHLNPPWDALTHPGVIALLLGLALIEFFADKIPAVNHLNDALHTVIRPVAGAVAFAASAHVISDVHPVLALALGLLVAGSGHTVKAGAVRPAITATTGGLAHPLVSLAEDVAATVVSLLAVLAPLVLVMAFTAGVLIWLLRRQRRAVAG